MSEIPPQEGQQSSAEQKPLSEIQPSQETTAKERMLFEKKYERALKYFLKNWKFEQPVSPDPFSLGISEKTPEEMTPDELAVMQRVLLRQLGLDEASMQQKIIGTPYTTPTPPEVALQGDILVTKYKTNREAEGLILQKLVFPDKEVGYVIGPDQQI